MSSPYHSGERQLQRAAGLDGEAAHVAQIIQPRLSSTGAKLFLSLVETIVVAGLDDRRRCWVTACTGRPGFVRTTSDQLHIVGGLRDVDSLAALGPGDPVGTLAIDMARRRRFRVNGTIQSSDCDGITIAVREAYANCPKYIDTTTRIEPLPPPEQVTSYRQSVLTVSDVSLLDACRTFFIGSVHPNRGADASHRGGEPGFVQTDNNSQLRFSDYAGNAMFNTLGNLSLNPTVGLLFIGPGGDRLQITGTATIHFHEPSAKSPEGRTILVQIDESQRWTLVAVMK